jgi:hypothetical protein
MQAFCVLLQFEVSVSFWHLPGKSEKNHDYFKSEQVVCRPKYSSDTEISPCLFYRVLPVLTKNIGFDR